MDFNKCQFPFRHHIHLHKVLLDPQDHLIFVVFINNRSMHKFDIIYCMVITVFFIIYVYSLFFRNWSKYKLVWSASSLHAWNLVDYEYHIHYIQLHYLVVAYPETNKYWWLVEQTSSSHDLSSVDPQYHVVPLHYLVFF